jgi:hypothetical protein
VENLKFAALVHLRTSYLADARFRQKILFNFTLKRLFRSDNNFNKVHSYNSVTMKQTELSMNLLLKLSLVLVWIFGLGSIEGCTSSRSFGDYRVIKKTDSDTDRVVVSLEEDTR